MNYDYPKTEFSKAVLAGVFAGIIATLANLAYDFIYRGAVGLTPSEFINVPSIIFVTMLLFTLAGLVYFVLDKLLKQGNIIYIVLFIVLTIISLYAGMHVTRNNNPLESSEFRVLLSGTIVVSGLLVSFLVPYLMKHDSYFI